MPASLSQPGQHGVVSLEGAGFAEDLLAEGADLVGADHQRAWVSGRDGTCLGGREPDGEFARGFMGQGGFVHLGGLDIEAEAEPGEQFPPVTRGRGEAQGPVRLEQIFFGHRNNSLWIFLF